mgnify:CR=1 FL=1
MKNAKRSVIITAILAIIMCASLAAGATFALFTSNSSVNIVITSANVEVNADVKVTETWHENNGERADGLYDTGKAEVTYENNQAKLTLSNFVPTDGVKLAVSLKNESTVKIKYRVLLLADRTVGTELLDELDIDMNGMAFRGYTLATEYVELEAGASIDDIPVTIVFPKEADKGMNVTCNLAIKVEAQQGNAVADNTFEVTDGNTIISETAEDGSVWYSEVDNTTLFKEIANGAKLAGDVKFTDNVDPAKTIVAADGSDVEINANGKTVANTDDIWSDDDWSLVSAQGGSTVTISGNGTFHAKENDCYAADVCDGSTLVIENGTFIGNVHAVYVFEGTAEIKGGFFDIQQLNTNGVQNGYGLLINCYDTNHKNGTANIIVTGGTFVNFNPANCQAEGAHTNFVADGYTVVSTKQTNGDVWYTVVAKDAAGKTFSDGKDVVLNESIAVGAANGIAVTVENGSNLVIEGGMYNGGEGGNNQSVRVENGSKLTIKDGVFTVGGDADGYGNSVIENRGGEIVIEGGFFYTDYAYNKFYYVLNQLNNNPGTITVKGGTFVNYDPSKGDDNLGGNFVAAGYKVVSETKDNGEVWYTVVSATAKVDTITADENGTIASSDVTDAITEAFKDGTNTGVEVTLPAGSIKLKGETPSAVENVVKGKNVTFVGNGADTVYENLPVDGATGEGNADYSLQGAASVTFKNMTINLGAKDYNGFVRADNLYFENCKIIGRGSYWGVGEVVFKNCEFTAPDADYCITLYSGKSFTFENCTFNSAAGKFINAYVEQFEGEANVVNLTNCVFNAGKANKAAICLKSYKNAIWKVTFTNCNVEQCKADGDTDDLPTGSKYYSVRNETGTVPAGTTVTVDGTVVWANGAKA